LTITALYKSTYLGLLVRKVQLKAQQLMHMQFIDLLRKCQTSLTACPTSWRRNIWQRYERWKQEIYVSITLCAGKRRLWQSSSARFSNAGLCSRRSIQMWAGALTFLPFFFPFYHLMVAFSTAIHAGKCSEGEQERPR